LAANDLGPQTLYYVPEGILNHNGENTIAIGVISIDETATLGTVTIEPFGKLLSAKPEVSLVDSPSYLSRKTAHK
jgi:hypothetical protein